MRRLLLLTAALVATVATAVPTPATAATHSWVTSVRTAHHSTFDRLVLTFHGPVPNYHIKYVKKVHSDPSGKVVRLKGNAKLLVEVDPTLSTAKQPQGTRTPLLPEIRQIKGAGNFEGYTSYGVGLAAREPYHAHTLSSPSRLVIDVQLPTT
jgi:hypothetical protein